MKIKHFKPGMRVYDVNSPELRGEVVEVLKTRIKVQFLGRACATTYDAAHCQFLKETEGNKWKKK